MKSARRPGGHTVKRSVAVLGFVLIAAVFAIGFIGPPSPFADHPDGVPLPLGELTVTMDSGNPNYDLYQRVGWRWRQIAAEWSDGEWVPTTKGFFREVFCTLELALGGHEVRLPDLPPGTYRVCRRCDSGCSESVHIP